MKMLDPKMDNYTVPSDKELDELLKKTFTSIVRPSYTNVQGFVLPERFLEFEQIIKEFEVFDDDVWICGFPKTGTTWISEIAWLISHDLDYEGAKELDYVRTRLLDFCFLFDNTKEQIFGANDDNIVMDSIKSCKSMDHPRNIKSHLPYQFLPEQLRNGRGKIICTARNPMDVCISYYHQCANFERFSGTFDEFCKLFLYGKTNYGPYPQHVLSFWKVKHNPNILFLTYEEMKRDLPKVLRTVANFLGKKLSEDDFAKLAKHVSFDEMKNNPAVNKKEAIKNMEDLGHKIISPFIRKGKVGGYKSVMSQDLIRQFDYWMPKKFEGSGLNLLNV